MSPSNGAAWRKGIWLVLDAVSRLSGLGLTLPSSTNNHTIGAVGGVGTPIGYNPAGQIASIARSNDAFATARPDNTNLTYTTNGLNQYSAAGPTTLGYDTRGNLTSSASGAGTESFTYSKLGELLTGPGVSLNYDGASRLIRYTVGSAPTRFYYAGASLVAELSSTNALLRRYVPGPGVDETVVWYEGSGTADRRWLMGDERGSVMAVTDAGANVITINRFDEYGYPTAANQGRFQYTGQTWLRELGVYNYKARMYSFRLGRFMQTDPIGYGDGLNWYAYVGGDPVNRTDPSGECGASGNGAASECIPFAFYNYGSGVSGYYSPNLLSDAALDRMSLPNEITVIANLYWNPIPLMPFTDVAMNSTSVLSAQQLGRASVQAPSSNWFTTPQSHDISGTAICWKACGPGMIDPVQTYSPAEQAGTLAAFGGLTAGALLAPAAPGALANSQTFGVSSSRFGNTFYRGSQGSWNHGTVRLGWSHNKATGNVYLQIRVGNYHVPTPIFTRAPVP